MKLKVKKLNEDAKIPNYATFDDAGMDLFAIEDVVIEAGKSAVIKTGISMEIPTGHVGLIWDKSGIGIKHNLKVMGGVIDSGYRGEIMIGMMNLSQKDYSFMKGDKVAQMIIQTKESPEIIEVEELKDSERGEGVFGSTGKQ